MNNSEEDFDDIFESLQSWRSFNNIRRKKAPKLIPIPTNANNSIGNKPVDSEQEPINPDELSIRGSDEETFDRAINEFNSPEANILNPHVQHTIYFKDILYSSNFNHLLNIFQTKHSISQSAINDMIDMMELYKAENGYIKKELPGSKYKEMTFDCGDVVLLDIEFQLKKIIESNFETLASMHNWNLDGHFFEKFLLDTKNSNEIIIPAVLYCDGVQVHKNSRLQLHPFYISLLPIPRFKRCLNNIKITDILYLIQSFLLYFVEKLNQQEKYWN